MAHHRQPGSARVGWSSTGERRPGQRRLDQPPSVAGTPRSARDGPDSHTFSLLCTNSKPPSWREDPCRPAVGSGDPPGGATSMIEAEDWTPVTDWAAELRQPGFWGWWYFQAIHGDDDGWEARYAVFGEDFTSYDLDPIFGPEPERDFDIDGPQGSVLELPFPGGYGWRVHFDAGFPGAYHSPTSSRRCGWPTTSRTTCRPYCGGPRRGGSRSTWPTGGGGRRPRYPAELIPLLFFPLALLTTEAEAEDAR